MQLQPGTFRALSQLVAANQAHRALLELLMAIDHYLVQASLLPQTHDHKASAAEAELWSAMQEARVVLRRISEINRAAKPQGVA